MRLFIALPVSKEPRDKISKNLTQAISSLGNKAKFLPDYQWHFTLVFLGNQPESEVPIIKEAINETAEESKKIEVNLKKITYGPSIKKPRMVWLVTDKQSNKKMAEVKKKLVNNLEKKNVSWNKGNRKFNAHITLARARSKYFENTPEIEKNIDINYQPSNIKLIKSTLKRSGAEYEVIFRS